MTRHEEDGKLLPNPICTLISNIDLPIQMVRGALEPLLSTPTRPSFPEYVDMI